MTPCDVVGCSAEAVVALEFRGQPGHVHVCREHEAIDREWADVVRSAWSATGCPWPCSAPLYIAQPSLLEEA